MADEVRFNEARGDAIGFRNGAAGGVKDGADEGTQAVVADIHRNPLRLAPASRRHANGASTRALNENTYRIRANFCSE
jgi:hypothetical protein